ncbi:MAG: nucleoside triphosphate pyrophosphohydrolase [Actinomycetota bacterium]|nr:nucleoside triphosphate pyrophosphohydrolase [Actinomycetota bacterium]
MARPGATRVRAKILVVGLGPGDPGLIGVETRRILERVDLRFVRTRRHPNASQVGEARSFDDVYERAGTVDAVYPAIVETLVQAAGAAPDELIVYAVPGSPLVAERTVELLRLDPRVTVEVIPALSFMDLAWDRLGVDPFAGGVRLIDGHRFATEAAGSAGPLLVSQCDSRQVLSEIKLAVDNGPEVVVLARLGLPDEAITTLAWADLDREVAADHLTCLWIPHLADPVAAEVIRFEDLVRTLRVACPWDRQQTHASLTSHLLEESYEVVEAIDELAAATSGGEGEAAAYQHLEEELGDLFFQVMFHAVIAAEAGRFTVSDVARGINDKLVRRHPHVFSPAGSATSDLAASDPVASDPVASQTVASDTAVVVADWEHAKKQEKGRSSIMDGIPPGLPTLLTAAKVSRKAASVGFDWDDVDGVWNKVTEEIAELRAAIDGTNQDVGVTGSTTGPAADELGDVLFTVVNLARHLDVDAEGALRAATAKFRRRFAAMELTAESTGSDLAGLGAAAWDRLWARAKEMVDPDAPSAR